MVGEHVHLHTRRERCRRSKSVTDSREKRAVKAAQVDRSDQIRTEGSEIVARGRLSSTTQAELDKIAVMAYYV